MIWLLMGEKWAGLTRVGVKTEAGGLVKSVGNSPPSSLLVESLNRPRISQVGFTIQEGILFGGRRWHWGYPGQCYMGNLLVTSRSWCDCWRAELENKGKILGIDVLAGKQWCLPHSSVDIWS